MNKTKNEVKEKKTYDVEESMKSAVNVMFIQMQATQGFNLFGERAVDVIIKNPNNRKKELCQEKKL